MSKKTENDNIGLNSVDYSILQHHYSTLMSDSMSLFTYAFRRGVSLETAYLECKKHIIELGKKRSKINDSVGYESTKAHMDITSLEI